MGFGDAFKKLKALNTDDVSKKISKFSGNSSESLKPVLEKDSER